METAREAGSRANEALVRSAKVMDAWMARRSETTGLLPNSGDNGTWQVNDAAADLYPFLAIAAARLRPESFRTEMMDVLRDEIRWTTRAGRLSDHVERDGDWAHDELDIPRVIFGSCEYAKDGLLPLVEYLNHPAYYDRLTGIAEDMIRFAPHVTNYGQIPAGSSEVNGEFLQVLSRLLWRTDDPWYLEHAVNIATLYFDEIIPGSGGLPPTEWDFGRGAPAADEFRFSDHGNEIVGGLSELVLYLQEVEHADAGRFADSLAVLVDRLLAAGRNEDGVWVMSVTTRGEPVDTMHAHCWGYLFNAVYATWMITEEDRFLEAVETAMRAVTDNPAYLDDPEGGGRGWGSNAYSDAIESAIVLLNRLPDERTEAVLDTAVTRFLARQRESGIVEDWYGDGNYVRTAMMYALMKAQGCWAEPWRPDVAVGAALDGDELVLTVESDQAWRGTIHFDYPRHREHWNMYRNYPRLNEWPEWYTVQRNRLYEVTVGDGDPAVYSGQQLIDGLEVSTGAMAILQVRVAGMGEPPYGKDK